MKILKSSQDVCLRTLFVLSTCSITRCVKSFVFKGIYQKNWHYFEINKIIFALLFFAVYFCAFTRKNLLFLNLLTEVLHLLK